MGNDSLLIALQYLQYLSESSKNMQNSRLDTGWTVYLSLLSLFVIVPGAFMTLKRNFPLRTIRTTQGVLILLALAGILFIVLGQLGNNKNRVKYAAADEKIEEILIEIGGIRKSEKGKYVDGYSKDFFSKAGRWITTSVMAFAIITLLSGSILVINSYQNREK